MGFYFRFNQKRDSYIERVLVYDLDKTTEQDQFSPPNFKIDMGNYGKSQGTDLKSWNDLLDTNLSTSQQIIDKYISGSFGGTPLNLDYTHFKSFVKYSSAVERVNNFQYKLTLIESFNKRVTTLESVSGSEAMTNISQSIVRKDNVVSGMDGWERWMYQEKTGSLYTHYSSSAYPLEPWPKDVHISGSLKHWEKVVFKGEELIGVIWKSEYGVMRDVDYPFDQVVIVLEGTLTLRPDHGSVQHYKEGDIFLYPKGFTGLWEMPDNYKELIIINKNALTFQRQTLRRIIGHQAQLLDPQH